MSDEKLDALDNQAELLGKIMTERSFERSLNMLFQAAAMSNIPDYKLLHIARAEYLTHVLASCAEHIVDHQGDECAEVILEEYCNLKPKATSALSDYLKGTGIKSRFCNEHNQKTMQQILEDLENGKLN